MYFFRKGEKYVFFDIQGTKYHVQDLVVVWPDGIHDTPLNVLGYIECGRLKII